MKKQRADELLIRQGWAEDLEKAKRFIMTGKVYTRDEKQILTAGEKWSMDTEVYIKGNELKYVSRGGLKLISIRHDSESNLSSGWTGFESSSFFIQYGMILKQSYCGFKLLQELFCFQLVFNTIDSS